MKVKEAEILATFIGFALLSVGLSSTQAIGAEKIVAGGCFMDECFKEYIVSLKRENSGLVIARTRIEHSYADNRVDAPPPPENFTYKILCTIPGGYIESVGRGQPNAGRRIPEPEQDPPHATQSIKQLWTAVCSRMTGR